MGRGIAPILAKGEYTFLPLRKMRQVFSWRSVVRIVFSKFAPFWSAVLLSSCGTMSESFEPVSVADVEVLRTWNAGRGLFVVRPHVYAAECEVAVAGAARPIACDTEYLIACDDSADPGAPFCKLVSEIGSDRISTYPQEKRR